MYRIGVDYGFNSKEYSAYAMAIEEQIKIYEAKFNVKLERSQMKLNNGNLNGYEDKSIQAD